MKAEIYLFCVAVALATFISGTGFFVIENYFQSFLAAEKPKAELTAPAPIFVEQAAAAIAVRQTENVENTEENINNEFDAEGYYMIVGNSPKGFENVGEIGVTTKSYENASEENNYEGTPAPPEGYLWTDKEFKFTKISISSETMAFETETIKSVRYQFNGKFIEKIPSENYDQKTPMFEGVITKQHKGKIIAESSVSLMWYEGGC